MTPRKTVEVAFIVDQVNMRLAIPASALFMKAPGKDREMTPEESGRLALASLLECVLHYSRDAGFGYLGGVVPDPDEGREEWGDETRRVYYMKRR